MGKVRPRVLPAAAYAEGISKARHLLSASMETIAEIREWNGPRLLDHTLARLVESMSIVLMEVRMVEGSLSMDARDQKAMENED